MARTTEMSFLTPGEVAGILRVHINTVYRMISDDEIHAVRVGKKHRIPRSEFEEQFGLTEEPAA